MKIKNLLLSIVITTAFCLDANAQNVGIGTAVPHASAKLHIEDANRGLMIPRVSLAAVTNGTTPVNAPLTGLLVFNTNAAVTGGNGQGFYYWDGTIWQRLQDGNGDAWLLNGNAGTVAGTNFLGTLDAQDLVFKTNNIENMRINTSGNVDIGAAFDDARVYARIMDTDLTTNYGLYVYHDGGITAGVTYGINNLNYSATNSTKYGIYNYTNSEGTGFRYGFYNATYLNAASTSTVYGIRNYVSTSGAATNGTQYGLYNYLTSSAATGVHYSQLNYLYLNTASTANNYGEYTYLDYASGARYGEYKTMGTSTLATGTVYGDYNYVAGIGNDEIFGVVADISNTGTGTHYGVYSNVPGGTNDYAAMFYAGNVVMNENAGDYDLRVEGTTMINLFKVDASQNKIGIGVATPTYLLDIDDPGITDPTYVYRGRNSTATGTRTQIGSIEYFQDQSSTIDFTGGSNFSINLNAAAAYDLQLATNSAGKPGSNAWTVVSDRRLKEDINPFKDGLSVLRNIEPVYFKYNGKANIKEENYFVGVIAQDLEAVAPYMVGSFESADGKLPFGEQEANTETYKSVDNGAMTYIAINAIKELDAQQAKVKETFKNISDFGVARLTAVETFVTFDEDFKNKLSGTPVVTVTPVNSTATLTIVNQTKEGFTVKVNGAFQAADFNWVAMAKINEDALKGTTQYDKAERQAMLEKVKAEKAKINYEAEYTEAELRKQEAALNETMESNNAATILPVPGESPIEEPEEPEVEEVEEK